MIRITVWCDNDINNVSATAVQDVLLGKGSLIGAGLNVKKTRVTHVTEKQFQKGIR